MVTFQFLICLLIGFFNCETQILSNIEVCLKTLSDTGKVFEVLPGIGWDNLRNTEEYRVIDISYNFCKTTADRKFLIPDDFNIEPVKSSFIETFAETFDSFHSYTSATSLSINMDFSASESGLFGTETAQVSGSFSSDYQSSKNEQLKRNSALMRVSARYPRYTASMNPDARLHPSFRNRLHKIAALIDANQISMAKFETELLIRDFGTHVVSSNVVGGILIKEDYISRTSGSTSNEFGIDVKTRLQAGLSFNAFFFKASAKMSFGMDFSHSEIDSSAYSQSLSNSKVATYGGPIFKSENFSIEQWEDGLEANLIAINRKGTPIFQFINPYVLPELSTETVYKLENLATQAVVAYYQRNTVYGCMDPTKENFNIDANVDDGMCGVVGKTFLFGGVYQTCRSESGIFCDTFGLVNPRTNDYSCPQGFNSVLLWNSTKSYAAICRSRFIMPVCEFWFDDMVTILHYSIYWCSPHHDKPLESPGLLFGGFWNTVYQSNPLTRSQYCPSGFIRMSLGLDLTLCYAEDIDYNRKNSVIFGGFFSSLVGNPIATKNGFIRTKPTEDTVKFHKRCPPEFTKYLVTIDEDTEIYYCGVAKKSNGSEIKGPVRPPFMRRPMIKQYDLQNAFTKMSEMEAASFKMSSILDNAQTKYYTAAAEFQLGNNLTQSSKTEGTYKNEPKTIVVAVAAVTGVVGLVLIVIIVWYIRKRKVDMNGESMPLMS